MIFYAFYSYVESYSTCVTYNYDTGLSPLLPSLMTLLEDVRMWVQDLFLLKHEKVIDILYKGSKAIS